MKKVYSKEAISKKLEPIFRKYEVKKAILFGSYATKNADFDSDVDLCVDSSVRGLKFIGMIEEIRRTLKKDADVVRLSEVIGDSRLEAEIKKDGVVIYER